MDRTDTSNLTEKLREVLLDENKSGIYICLRLYAPLNLKAISQIMNKSESTLHPHVKYLRENNIIVEQKMGATYWGKYYRINDEILDLYEAKYIQQLEEFEGKGDEFLNQYKMWREDNSDNEKLTKEIADKLKEDIETMNDNINSIEGALTVNKNIQSIVLNNYKNIDVGNLSDKELIEKFSSPNHLGSFNQVMHTFALVDIEDVLEFSNTMVTFLKSVRDLQEKVKEKISKRNIDEGSIGQQYFYLFTGPLPVEFELN